MKQWYVYIMASKTRVLYTGVTSDFLRRVCEHKGKVIGEFTAKYDVTNLVYFELLDDPRAAIAREKQIKGWLLAKKIALVESMNPRWMDLSEQWLRSSEIGRNGIPGN